MNSARIRAVAIFLSAVACCGGSAFSSGVLRLEFRPSWDGAPLVSESPTPGTPEITRLDWLVSDLALQRKDGSWTEGRDWHGFLSAIEGRLHVDADGVPAEDFRAIRFRVGVDAATNQGDPAHWPPEHALNPGVNHLHWGWQGGYVFLALEGRWPGSRKSATAFSYHLAGVSEPMVVALPVEFRGGGPITIRIEIDAAKLLDGVDPVRDANATHSRPGDALAQRMERNAVTAFRVESIRHDLLQPVIANAAGRARPPGTRAYPLEITQRFPQVTLPSDNPLTIEGVELGRRLFNEPRLSVTGTQSCASCHDRTHAFAEARQFSVGAEGQIGKRNAMPLFNLAWGTSFFWDGRAKSLRAQVLEPIQDAHEMNERVDRVVAKLGDDANYSAAFERAFGGREITADRMAMALEQFLLTLVSQESRFDRAVRQVAELTDQEKRGLQLFVTEFDPARGLRGADCFHCHGGTLFTDEQFHDNGLALAETDVGRMAVSGLESDRGKFKAPSLRNVAVTAPYMHDGRFATLEEVIEHYNSGVRRNPNLDPNLGKHPAGGLGLTADEKRALVAFLKTLTDEPFTQAPSDRIQLVTQTDRPNNR